MVAISGAPSKAKYASAGAAESPPDDPHPNEDARTSQTQIASSRLSPRLAPVGDGLPRAVISGPPRCNPMGSVPSTP